MVIYLPAQASEDAPVLDELTPREIVRELDKYVVGQADAKRAVAIALRNRIRRQKLDPYFRSSSPLRLINSTIHSVPMLSIM